VWAVALEQKYILPCRALRCPELALVAILERRFGMVLHDPESPNGTGATS
jgi:hypothetical protein